MDDLKLIDKKTLAKILGISKRTVERWRKVGKIPEPSKNDGRPFWTVKQIEEWVKPNEC
jgi:predicted site-specific integrase-resolvase